MNCCNWDTFEGGFICTWHTSTRRGAPPSTILIDWKRARGDWKRYGMTGHEAAFMQLRDLRAEAEHLWGLQLPRPRRGGGGGGESVLA